MSKLKDTLLMMAELKETFEVNGKTFQIIEVKEAEQPQPDYSHLVGKWVKYWLKGFEDQPCFGKWFLVNKVEMKNSILFIYVDGEDMEDSFRNNVADGINNTSCCFDLTNPQDTNPDEVQKILVPKEIGIGITRGRDIMGIIFGMNQFLVSPDVYEYPYLIWGTDLCTPIQCELIKCERAELKKGDLAFRTSENEPSPLELAGYCVVINSDKHCFVSNSEDVVIDYIIDDHWYKVVPLQSTNK